MLTVHKMTRQWKSLDVEPEAKEFMHYMQEIPGSTHTWDEATPYGHAEQVRTYIHMLVKGHHTRK